MLLQVLNQEQAQDFLGEGGILQAGAMAGMAGMSAEGEGNFTQLIAQASNDRVEKPRKPSSRQYSRPSE